MMPNMVFVGEQSVENNKFCVQQLKSPHQNTTSELQELTVETMHE